MAEKVFEQVFEGGVCEPDEIAIVELVKGYLTIGHDNMPLWQKATSLCAQMSNKYGIKRTAVTYNVLLQCCANTNDFEREQKRLSILCTMKKSNRVRRRLKLSKRGGAFDLMRRRF